MGHVSYIHYSPVGNVCVQIPTSSVRITQRNHFFNMIDLELYANCKPTDFHS